MHHPLIPSYMTALGQNMQWRLHHKKICKMYNRFTSSAPHQALAPCEKLDAILLSHLVAEISSSNLPPTLGSPGSTFLSLLQGPAPHIPVPPICPIAPPIPRALLNTLFSRFGNNNFAIHSHLSTFGHGIFPLASRLFNHSCVPNAAAKYILSPSQPVRMEIVALREISKDEEVRRISTPMCLPDTLKSFTNLTMVHRSAFLILTPPYLKPANKSSS